MSKRPRNARPFAFQPPGPGPVALGPALLKRIRLGHRGLAAALHDEHDAAVLLGARIVTLGANHHLTSLAIADRVDQLGAQSR